MVVIRDYDVVVREDYDVWIPEHFHTGWQKLRGHADMVPRKVWTWTKKIKPYHTLFCRNNKICRDLRTFLGQLQCLLDKCTITWYVIHIILNCKRICRENSNYAFDESFEAIFATTERGQLLPPYRYLILVLMMVF